MAIFGNFKGTTQSEFKIGKSSNGSKISTGTQPSSDLTNGDLYIDSSNSTLQVYNNAWVSVGSTLTDLNVDSGTLYVDSSNDTVSVGSTTSNDKLFVNGSLRLGTNPSLKHSGAYLDVSHTNGSATQLRIRDNENSGSDPIFKIYNANNTSEVFKVQGSTIRINDAYTLPTSDGTNGQALVSYGNGQVYWGTVEADALNNIVEDATPQLGGNLDAMAYNISNATTITATTFSGDVTGNVTGTVSSIANHDTDNLTEGSTNLYFSNARVQAVSIDNVLEDTTPQLGGNLDLNSNNIDGSGSIDITGTITATGNITAANFIATNFSGAGTNTTITAGSFTSTFDNTGNVSLPGNLILSGNILQVNSVDFTLPTSDGTSGQVLQTDGSGTLSFTTVSATPAGSNTEIQFNDGGSFGSTDAFTFDKATNTLETGIVRGVIFEPILDYGSITETANMTIDYGAVTDSASKGDFEYLSDTYGPTGDTFSVSGLPSAAQPGQMIYVSDETGGATMAFSDGTNWRRITDRAVVS